MELSPGSFRTFVVGTSYQLGNLVSSASSTIEATIGQRFPLPPKISGKKEIQRYKYGKVICIFMGCVYAYTILLTLVGPECRGKLFGVAHDSDMAIAAGSETVEKALRRRQEEGIDDVADMGEEKVAISRAEVA